VAGTLEEPEKDETGWDGGIEDTKENQCRNHEREGNLFKQFVAQRSKGGSRVVLCSGISVNDGAHQAEENDFRNGNGPKSLGEVIGVLHLSDEARNGDLADEGVANVQECAHTTDEGGACSCDDEDSRLTDHTHFWTFGDTYASVVIVRVLLDPSKDGRQENGNERKEGRKRCQLRKSVERSGQRAYEAYDSHDGREANSTHATVGHCIEILGASQYV